MECFAAFLSYTDQQIGRVLDFIEDLGDADNTVVIIVSDNGASSEGGKEGTINEGRLSNFEGATIEEMYDRIDEIGGPEHSQQLPMGLDHGGEHPVQTLEARGPRGRRRRPVHRPPAGRPTAVPRVGASVGSTRTRSTLLPTVLELVGLTPPAEIDGIPQSHLDGTSFASCSPRGARPSPAGTSPSTSRCSARGRSITTGGRRWPTTRSVRSMTTGCGPTHPGTTTCGSSTT